MVGFRLHSDLGVLCTIYDILCHVYASQPAATITETLKETDSYSLSGRSTHRETCCLYLRVPQTQTSSFLGFPEAYTHIQETVHKSVAGSVPLGYLPVLKQRRRSD